MLFRSPDDDVNLLRIINTPRRGIGKVTIERLNAIAKAKASPMRTAMEAARSGGFLPVEGGDAGAFGGLPERAIADIGVFIDLLDEWREELLGKKKIADRVRKLIDSVDYWGYLIEENRANDKAAKWKFHNVETFIGMIRKWEDDPDNLSLGLFNWLNRITLITSDDDGDEDEGKVNLMTIHAAKGLEFEVVFIAGCEDGIIPHARSLEEGGELAEERRLFYVAVTRARKRLIITSCARRRRQKDTVEQSPSPFLEEIPKHLISMRDMATEYTEEEGEAFFGKIHGMFGGSEGEASGSELP